MLPSNRRRNSWRSRTVTRSHSRRSIAHATLLASQNFFCPFRQSPLPMPSAVSLRNSGSGKERKENHHVPVYPSVGRDWNHELAGIHGQRCGIDMDFLRWGGPLGWNGEFGKHQVPKLQCGCICRENRAVFCFHKLSTLKLASGALLVDGCGQKWVQCGREPSDDRAEVNHNLAETAIGWSQ